MGFREPLSGRAWLDQMGTVKRRASLDVNTSCASSSCTLSVALFGLCGHSLAARCANMHEPGADRRPAARMARLAKAPPCWLSRDHSFRLEPFARTPRGNIRTRINCENTNRISAGTFVCVVFHALPEHALRDPGTGCTFQPNDIPHLSRNCVFRDTSILVFVRKRETSMKRRKTPVGRADQVEGNRDAIRAGTRLESA
jgi:hypothetical protein